MSDKEHINPIAKFAVERRVTMTMAVLGVFVLGYLSLTRLPLEFMPSFSSNSMWVSAPYSSSSPEEVERLIVRPLEDILGTINGIDTLSATASATEGSVSITFKDNVDMDLAAVEVRDRIDRVRHLLPDDLRRIRVRRFQSTDIPVFRFHLSTEWDRDRFYEFTEQVVQRRLERLEGVASVEVRGIRKRELQVQLRPSRLQAAGLDARDVTSVLRNNHANVSAGYIKEGARKLIVRSVGEFKTVEEIEKLPIGSSGAVGHQHVGRGGAVVERGDPLSELDRAVGLRVTQLLPEQGFQVCGLDDLLQPQRVHPALRQVDLDIVLVDRLPAFEVEALDIHDGEGRSQKSEVRRQKAEGEGRRTRPVRRSRGPSTQSL